MFELKLKVNKVITNQRILLLIINQCSFNYKRVINEDIMTFNNLTRTLVK